ncbi:MAG: hypothetical protein KME28_14120 [Pelatocladus maniniholoensis HA4357-MV3]|jgi:hypothetical protein|uniref:Uncharacterized protein n=1 Tax=Pelatocladus maniniholoensis HA4357-MV3 TaxID=1117104 RepID=A0A9E3LUA7_9NOST|nr:hypothetical protein [Pelatocladus maniniholoensis HA4357-MV3]BAZ67595.1 para-aminobenzoate synthase component I [Fischerella sp. NIES-4106]
MTQPWYWRSLPLNNRTDSDIFAALFGYKQTYCALQQINPSSFACYFQTSWGKILINNSSQGTEQADDLIGVSPKSFD